MSEPSVQHQADFCPDETDFVIKSVVAGACEKCGQPLICRNSCYSPAGYTGDTKSNIALEKGVCATCGRMVVCLRGHLGGDELKASVYVANVALRATGLYGGFREPNLTRHFDADTRLADLALEIMASMVPEVKASPGKILRIPKLISRKHSKAHEPWERRAP
ncbi:MAG: hypothetical protein AUJ11_02510 [Parcubacteria group bacterium CG1_02_44_65]|nr:MAG: hypothetical protein AUJ11_02510 [Parcubacteria group bacterium CG1_02_44_65]